MIECIPKTIKKAILYLHSAGTNSMELKPFLSKMEEELPDTYIWAGDGVICGSPLMNHRSFYGVSKKRYWFMFPMQDSSTQKSFYENKEPMGASLLSGGAFLNRYVDIIKKRFNIPTKNIVLAGLKHGSCLALTASMMRRDDPFSKVILFEPFLLESYYLKNEFIQKETEVICIENQFIRNKVKNWLNIDTNEELKKMGLNVKKIILNEGEEKLDMNMIDEAINILKQI